MQYRKILLLLATLIIIVILLNIGMYRRWFRDRILPLSTEIHYGVDNMDYEFRRKIRYGHTYTMAHYILMRAQSSGIQNPVVLIPPQKYVFERGIEVVMPEPVVLYLFAHVKGVMPGNKDVYKANMGIKIVDRELFIIDLSNKGEVDSLLADYQKL